MLTIAAALIGGHPRRLTRLRRLSTTCVVAVLTLRGITGVLGSTHILVSWTPSARFRNLDRRYYGPLCLVLAGLASLAAIAPGRVEGGGRAVTGSGAGTVYTVRIHHEPGQEYPLWVEVDELPGCFASGQDMDELREALSEAVSAHLSEPGKEVHVDLEVTEQRMLAGTA